MFRQALWSFPRKVNVWKDYSGQVCANLSLWKQFLPVCTALHTLWATQLAVSAKCLQKCQYLLFCAALRSQDPHFDLPPSKLVYPAEQPRSSKRRTASESAEFLWAKLRDQLGVVCLDIRRKSTLVTLRHRWEAASMKQDCYVDCNWSLCRVVNREWPILQTHSMRSNAQAHTASSQNSSHAKNSKWRGSSVRWGVKSWVDAACPSTRAPNS